MRIGRWLRLHGLRALRENSSPLRTSLGVGLGAFLGVFPTFGFGGPLAFLLAGRWGWNRAAAVGGAVISMNPLTAPFLIPLSAWIGIKLFQRLHIESVDAGPWQSALGYGWAFLLGNALLAIAVAVVFATAVYVVVKRKGGLRALVLKPRYGARAMA